MRDDVRLQDLQRRESGRASKLMNVKVPARVHAAIRA